MSEKIKCRYGFDISEIKSMAVRVCRWDEITMKIYSIESVCKDCPQREIEREG